MKLLLDEMWTRAIAEALRNRGHDAVAVTESGQSTRYAGFPDSEVFARAQEDGRAVVTDNVADFERARRDWEGRGLSHHGIVYALDPPFNRHRADDVVGSMVRALAALITSPEADDAAAGRVFYLRPPAG